MSAAAAVRPFDVCGPLPTGVTVLEASAGTGKTYTIAGLAARYVAEGVPLERLLVVTFTRMATAELRDRVRERLASAERGLAPGTPVPERDEVLRLLATGPAEEVAQRRRRLAAALATFDAATIVTTHGFCQEVLAGLGIAGDLAPDATFVEDLSDLREEVVEDLYVRRFHRDEQVAFGLDQARLIAREVVGNPAARVVPGEVAGDDSVAGMRVRLALTVRQELEARKRRLGVMTYDDLLMRLHDALRGPGGPAIAARLRERFGVVLVDEFQDTDPVQWDIVRLAFGGEGGSTVVLIGDPKQAIYAFRGADVHAYLRAAHSAGARETLDVSWRSDQGLIDAYDRLFGGARLGHEDILYRPVRAAAVNRAPRLHGAPHPEPLRVRVVHRDELTVRTTGGGYPRTDSAREHIARDLAADVVALLSSGATIEVRPDDGAPGSREPVAPGHLAVLVRRNRDAEVVRDALDAAGVPAVLTGAGSVFAAPAAQDWLRLLDALERPSHGLRAHAAALTAFLGWSAERVAGASEEEWEEVHRRLHGWAHLLRDAGVAALAERITLVERLPERLLRRADGERRLTDLRHVGQLLHAASMQEGMAVAALGQWLRRRIAAAEQEGDEERSRRLESDAAAVQVLTIHRSKGLEFPIVYLPYLWHPTWITREDVPVTFHDPDDDDVRKIDVGLTGPGYARNRGRHLAEQRGEDLRLAYVALTRARHQAVVWWAGTYDSRNSPLGRLVFARGEDGTVAESGTVTPSDADATARFHALAAEAPGCIGVERATLGLPVAWSGRAPGEQELDVSVFDRSLDVGWRRTSYSALTAGAHEARVGSEPEEDVRRDEPSDEEGGPPRPVGGAEGVGSPSGAARPDAQDPALPLAAMPAGPGAQEPALPLAAMPAGPEVGTAVHAVLERADFAAADLDAELARAVARARGGAGTLGESVVPGLRAALETRLGPVAGGLRLRDVPCADRLDELVFELPLVGGDAPTGTVTLAAVAAALRRHVAPRDPLAGYAERLEDPALRAELRGYLTGTIDLVVRLPGGRFLVVDHKTNRLAAPDEELTAWHYRPAALAAEMQRAHYVLQGLLYAVALHRYLRWRLAGYDPEEHLAGIAYLFLRGMAGPQTPLVDGLPCGVFAWRPSGALVEELSDVLDRGGEG